MHHLRLWSFSGLVLAFAIAAGSGLLLASKIAVEVHQAQNADFASIKTYTWLPSPPITATIAPGASRDPKAVQAALEPTIMSAVDAEFAKRGLKRVAENGDVQVVYYLAHGTDMVQSAMGSYYQYATDFYVGGLYGGQTTYSKVVEEGSLTIDIVDDRRAIWRAQASTKINRDNSDAKVKKRIEEAVGKMFAKYPKK